MASMIGGISRVVGTSGYDHIFQALLEWDEHKLTGVVLGKSKAYPEEATFGWH
jgi:hypothetical protein